jgi:predicted homoserine dehydrogenase-like protein
VAHTVAIAKKDLKAGDVLDGIGGFNQYGQIDTVWNCRGLLPIGLAEGVRLTRDVRRDEAIAMDAAEVDETRLLTKLWREQEKM